MKSAVQFALRCYMRFISPMLPASCKYTPTCSEYAMEAVERHGVLWGGLMSAWRLLRCNPFSKGGYDPVVAPPSRRSSRWHPADACDVRSYHEACGQGRPHDSRQDAGATAQAAG